MADLPRQRTRQAAATLHLLQGAAPELNLIGYRHLPELGEIIAGRTNGRTSGDQVTLFEALGMAIQDLYVAWRGIRT